MKNRIILPDLETYVVFADTNNHEILYAITKEEQKKKIEIVRRYNNKEEEVPEEYTVKAYRMGMVENGDPYYSKYDIIDKNPIDLPINRIYWIWIQCVPSNVKLT